IAAHASHTVEACLRRASAATAREDRLVALSQALALDPHHEAARRAMHEALERHLTDDAFLTYVGETDATYRVETPDGLRIVVPKRRAVPRPYPPTEPGPLRPASRWLLLALLGLLPSGLGTLLFAPIALFSALRLRPSTLRPKDQRRRRVFIAAALLLWILGLSLGLLVLIHL
ncbi:MAG: hypothetical protein ACOC7N_06165, partial [Chloroflexota bacterium]